MKYLLIAVYLAQGSTKPELRTEEFADKETCQAVAARYVKTIQGQSRAFCLRTNT